MVARSLLLGAAIFHGGARLSAAAPSEPPVILIGLDAYRHWDQWPLQRIGARAYMRSTYDRTGGNESADASHFLYQESKTFNVTLDLEGKGILYFARYNHWHGSPWHYEVDRNDFIVQESSSANPLKPVEDSVFLPEHLFPSPLTWTWSVTKGADLMWVPIPFEKSFRMAYSRTRYGTGYYIWHQYVEGAKLSQPLKSWDRQKGPERDVLELINKAGTDLLPKQDSAEAQVMGLKELSGKLDLPKNGSAIIQHLKEGSSMVRSIEFSIPKEQAVDFARATLKITWDRRNEPSVKTPVSLFYGTGSFYNRDNREYLVKGFPVFVRYEGDRVKMASFFPMPFFREAKIELAGVEGQEFKDIQWRVRYQPSPLHPSHVGYFHATYRDHAKPELGKDLVLLDTRNMEGNRDWSGSFVGTSFIFTDRNYLGTLEGDPRFFFDDSESPQAYGTGTEEWGGGGDYWGGRNMTLPFAGHPVGARNLQEAKNDEDKIHSAYRFLLGDLMPFGKNARIHLEHGGINQSTEHYQTVAFWYGAPAASLVKTDELKLGDPESEKQHGYLSPTASEPYEMTSRYELGADTYLKGYPAPKANPENFVEFEFEAEANVPYYIWTRGKAVNPHELTDAFWLQFNDDIGTDKMGESYQSDRGFGNWLDRHPVDVYAWSSALPQDPPKQITFQKAGKQRVRIQPRHPQHLIQTIWLSASQKELPSDKTRLPSVQSDSKEIVLRPENASKVQGLCKIVRDETAGSVQALQIDGEGETLIYPDPFRSRSEPLTVELSGSNVVVAHPPHTDKGRKMTGTSEFILKLQPNNLGAMLRRKLDYQYPNQRARVFIADASHPVKAGEEPAWKEAGIWYLAGGNTYIYSDPVGELGETLHHVQTSNRRFRDDEFLVPRSLTEGRSAIRVKIEFTPVQRPLFPGKPLPELAWSEIRYDAYCFVMPNWKP
ncbi:MAG: DUF2961 domain-containing protein [Verrucomicrobiales bacterium]